MPAARSERRMHGYGLRPGRIAFAVPLAVSLLIVALAAAMPAQAQRDKPLDEAARVERQREMEAKRGALEDSQRRAGETQRDIDRLSAEHAKLKEDLVQTAKEVQQSETRLTEVEERFADYTTRELAAKKTLAGRHAELAHLLGAMLRIGRNPPPVIITERQDVLQMIRSATQLARIFPQLNEKAIALAGELRNVEKLAGDSRNERDRLRAETTRHNESRTRLASLIEANRAASTERARELAAIRRESEAIQRTVTELDELISRHDRLVQSRTRMHEYDAEVRRQNEADAARRAAAQPTATPPTLPEGETPSAGSGGNARLALNVPQPPTESAVRPIVLAPGTGRALTNPGRLKPEIPFHRAKGRLPIPASGRHVLRFAEQTQFGSRSPGLVIATRPSAQITSPSDGWVLFAGPFRSYGQLLILNVGDGYHILLTGLSRIDAQVGQFVLAGEPVGAMSSVVSKGGDDNDGTVLYVEFRKDGKPIDPSPWWVDGQQKVQG